MKPIDYTQFSSDGKKREDQINKRWWLSPVEDMHKSVFAIVKLLSQYDSRRKAQYQVNARLYGNLDLVGLNGVSFSKLASQLPASKDRISYNVIQAGIDTLASKIAKNKPKSLYLTSGGNYKIQRKAKKLDKFVDGIFYENKTYELMPICFKDGAVFGDGFIHVFEEHGRVKHERVVAGELYTDWMEGLYGEPRQLHRVKIVDRDVLADSFPEHKKEILNVNRAGDDFVGSYQIVSDQVVVIESWRLPSGKDSKDGVHTINIENVCLSREPWENSFFPFARYSWSKRLYGYWSQGIPEQIQTVQLEINKILWIIQRSMHLAGTFKILMEKGSKIVKEHMSNEIGAMVMYTGVKPEYVVPQAVPVEYYQHLQTLKNSAFEQIGISQLSATSQKPAGLDSGKALREFNDIESDRYNLTGQGYENLSLDISKLSIWKAKEIFQRENKYSIRAPGKKFIMSIDWKEINLEDDEYVMKAFPVSSLPSDPAGRLQTIREYMDSGQISPRTGRKLLDFPDLEQVENLQNAQEDYLTMILDKIVDDGEYTAPEPLDNLELAKELVLEYYASGKTNGLEEDKLGLLILFSDSVSRLLDEAEEASKAKLLEDQQAQLGQQAQLEAPITEPQA
jgi:hypothetical protein